MRQWTTWDWKREPEAPRTWPDPENRIVIVEPDFWAPHGFDYVDAHASAWCAMQSSKAVFVARTRHLDMVPRQTIKTVRGTMELVPAELARNIIPAMHMPSQAEIVDAVRELLTVPATCRALWLEPVEAIDLSGILFCDDCRQTPYGRGVRVDDLSSAAGGKPWGVCWCEKPDWVIVRGTTEPMHPAWVRSIRDACREADVPFTFLGWGEWQIGSTLGKEPDAERVLLSNGRLLLPHRVQEDTTPDERHYWPSLQPEMVARVGAERSGALLDGESFDDRPEIAR